MLDEARKREKAANALLGFAFAASASQSPKDFVKSGHIESPGVAVIQRTIGNPKRQRKDLDNPRVMSRGAKTFKEFVEEAYLIEKTFPNKQAAVDYHKENPPYGDEPYHIRRKNKSGEPEAWRPVRAKNRNAQSSTRRSNANPLKYDEVLGWVRRNLIPNPEKTAKEMIRRETSNKKSQTTKARSETKKTGVLHTVDHPQPVSQDRRKPELRQRFQHIAPGDTSSNREIMPGRQNASKNSKPPKKGDPGWEKTRSGSIQDLYNQIK